MHTEIEQDDCLSTELKERIEDIPQRRVLTVELPCPNRTARFILNDKYVRFFVFRP